jgi:hypothetical protein
MALLKGNLTQILRFLMNFSRLFYGYLILNPMIVKTISLAFELRKLTNAKCCTRPSLDTLRDTIPMDSHSGKRKCQ